MSLAETLAIVFTAVTASFLAVLGWVARAMLDVRDGQRDLRQLLVGYDGKNGMRSQVERLEQKVERLEGK